MKRPTNLALTCALLASLAGPVLARPQEAEGGQEQAPAQEAGESAAGESAAGEGSTAAPDVAAMTPEEYMQFVRDEADLDQPVRLEWQRSVEDAEAQARKTGKPLLICVNIEEEIASEIFALHMYRDEDFGQAAQGFVPLIVSPARHTPRDHDERGRRIECPRFGSVTCGEHQKIEPQLFQTYFRGNRYAPRHVGVRLHEDAPPEFLFDLYLLTGTLTVVTDALREHGDNDWTALLASTSAEDRVEVEQAYLAGDTELRTELLTLARHAPHTPVELLRLGMGDEDTGLARLARQTLAATAGPESLDLLLETLATEQRPVARETLRVALARLASTEERAARELRIEEGLTIPSARVPVDVWRILLAQAAGSEPALPMQGSQEAATIAELEQRLDHFASQPESAASLLAMGNVLLELADAHLAAGGNPSYFLIDADDAARRAAELGAEPSAAAAIRAPSLWLSGRADEAGDQAALALASLVAEPRSARAAQVLDVLARSRTGALYNAERNGTEWSSEVLREAHAAYTVLGIHPRGTDQQAADHSAMLRYLKRDHENARVLENALARFPASAPVHTAFRNHIAATLGMDALDRGYEGVAITPENEAAMEWWIGYAAITVAQEQRRATLDEAARDAWLRATAHFEISAASNPDYAATANHYMAMSAAGRARIAVERGDLELAARLAGECIALCPTSAESVDGLGKTPLATLRVVRRALVEAQRDDLLESLGSVIEAAEPGLWTSSRAGFTQQ